MIGTPKVSAILAVYNGASYLDEACRSLSGQSLTDWECIVVDDGSTDRSRNIALDWAGRDPRFSVLTNARNLGLAASLNRALERARADYVARLDADDLCLSERFARQAAFLDAHTEVTVVGSAALFMAADGAPLGVVRMPERHSQIIKVLPRRNPLIHPSTMLRRAALVAAGGYDPGQRYAQDLELWARGAALGWRFHNLQEPLLKFRSQPATHSNHAWCVFRLRFRNGLRYGYPLRGTFWALVGLAHHGVQWVGKMFARSIGARLFGGSLLGRVEL